MKIIFYTNILANQKHSLKLVLSYLSNRYLGKNNILPPIAIDSESIEALSVLYSGLKREW